MKKVLAFSSILIVAAAAGVVAVVLLLGPDAEQTDLNGKPPHDKRIVDEQTQGKGIRKAKRVKRARKVVSQEEPGAVREEKPDFFSDREEMAKLSEEMRKIFAELQDALDHDDRKRVFAIVHALQGRDEWPDGIPNSVKKKALRALSWFGAAGIAEAVGFLADSDPEIRDLAAETFEKQFADNWDLGDYKLAETMKAMVKVVTDVDSLESFYDQFSNMRPSVRADAAVAIYDSGNEAAIKVLEENLGNIFSSSDFDYEVTNREGVEQYLKDAQQNESDSQVKREYDDMYGPMDWGW